MKAAQMRCTFARICPCSHLLTLPTARGRRLPCPFPDTPAHRCRASSSLAERRCVPCEQESGGLDFMGLCERLCRQEAEGLISQVDGWQIQEDANDPAALRIRREWKTKNFLRALDLCERIGQVAEAEGHHPDLHLTGWNCLAVELTTHARKGLTENDFVLAAKIDAIDKEGLLRKPKKKLADA